MAHPLSKVLLAIAADKDPRLLLPGFRIEKGNLAVFRQFAEQTASGIGWECLARLEIPGGGNRRQVPFSEETEARNSGWIPAADAKVANASPSSSSSHTRTGKIARLPKPIRDQIDQMLEDGATVDQIKDTLGDAVKDLTPNNFSEWKKGGHQDWRKDQFWRQEMRLRQEAFTDILEGADPIRLPESGLQLTSIAICELLREMCDTDADDQRTRVEKHVRIANALSRLSRSIIQLQQFRNESARDQAAELKQRDINQDLSDNEFDILTSKMDQVFRRPRKKPGSPALRSPSEGGSSNPVPSSPALRSLGEGGSSFSSSSSAAAKPSSSAPNLPANDGSTSSPVSSSSSSSPVTPVPIQPADVNATVAIPLPSSKHSEDGAATCSADIPGARSVPIPNRDRIADIPVGSTSPSPVATEISSVNESPCDGTPPVPPATAPSVSPDSSSPALHPSDGRPPTLSRSDAPRSDAPRSDAPRSDAPRPFPPEHCLECLSPLPALLPNGGRPRDRCDQCGFELPPPGNCVEPSIEQCHNCHANLPRLLPNGHRPSDYCHHCATPLPAT